MKSNPYYEALKEPANLVVLASAFALTGLLGPIPLLVALGAEAAYLLFFADSKYYRAVVSQRDYKVQAAKDEEAREHEQNKWRSMLSETWRVRYDKLVNIRDNINKQSSQDDNWYIDVVNKLDALLMNFMNFGLKENQLREKIEGDLGAEGIHGLGKTDRQNLVLRSDSDLEEVTRWAKDAVDWISQRYNYKAAALNKQISESEAGDATIPILQKRVELLERRRHHIAKSRDAFINVHHQLRLLEDTFGLIADETSLRPTQQVLNDIDDAVMNSSMLSDALAELDQGSYEALNIRLNS